jgi:hypothetical protein
VKRRATRAAVGGCRLVGRPTDPANAIGPRPTVHPCSLRPRQGGRKSSLEADRSRDPRRLTQRQPLVVPTSRVPGRAPASVRSSCLACTTLARACAEARRLIDIRNGAGAPADQGALPERFLNRVAQVRFLPGTPNRTSDAATRRRAAMQREAANGRRVSAGGSAVIARRTRLRRPAPAFRDAYDP